jgi:AraC-like DNA-binding protein
VSGSPWTGRLFLGPGLVLYLGPGGHAEPHAHAAVQLVLGDAVRVTVDGATTTTRAALIHAGVTHAFDADGRIALLLVERHGAAGRALDRVEEASVVEGLALPGETVSADEALAFARALLRALGVDLVGPRPSREVRAAIEYVESSLDGVPSLMEAARRTGLSPSRLTHRFAREAGLPFRRFVLWARVRRAVEAARAGHNLSEAAVEAGFADGAHLSRTFRAMFGLPPSEVLPVVEIVGAWR